MSSTEISNIPPGPQLAPDLSTASLPFRFTPPTVEGLLPREVETFVGPELRDLRSYRHRDYDFLTYDNVLAVVCWWLGRVLYNGGLKLPSLPLEHNSAVVSSWLGSVLCNGGPTSPLEHNFFVCRDNTAREFALAAAKHMFTTDFMKRSVRGWPCPDRTASVLALTTLPENYHHTTSDLYFITLRVRDWRVFDNLSFFLGGEGDRYTVLSEKGFIARHGPSRNFIPWRNRPRE